MTEPDPARAPLLARLRATHSLPCWEGAESRRHADVPVWRLTGQALRQRLRAPGRFSDVEMLVQFAGFPRSGHSLIGALLDAHPDALIAHELDAAGLFQLGLPAALVWPLIARNAEAFAAQGRWWNGFRYTVPGDRPVTARPRLIGDKKGDWAARRFARDPGLMRRIARAAGVPSRWVLVVRHPLDNIATMSLRTARAFDLLRIRHPGAAFRPQLRAAQADGRIPAEALDAMIDDYAGLCAAVAGMAASADPADWHELGYEAFTAAPEPGLRRLLAFLGLTAPDDYVADAISIVHPSASRSRDLLRWRPDQLARVEDLTARFAFLRGYAVADPAVADGG